MAIVAPTILFVLLTDLNIIVLKLYTQMSFTGAYSASDPAPCSYYRRQRYFC